MKLIVILLFIFGTSQLADAQYGMSAQFASTKLTSVERDDISSIETISPALGYHLGLNYWLRLRNVRLEFFPEIAYSHLNTTASEQKPDFTMQRWLLTLPASFYFLDFKGDCHCPTFSKQNDTVKKGLFLQLLTTLEHEKAKLEVSQDLKWHQNIGLGVGTGLDIGLSDFLTLTPLIQYIHTVYTSKEEQTPGTTKGWRAGVRVLFRPDYR